MAHIQIIVGSVLGASEYVAEAMADFLREKSHTVEIHLEPDINNINKQDMWLICSSTHGAGDLPDNIQAFAEAMPDHDVSNLPFSVVALGDSSYDTFCQAGNTLHQILVKQNAIPLADVFEIDVLQHPIPEDVAVEWLKQQTSILTL